MSMREDSRDKRRAVAWVVIGGGLLIGAVSFGLATSHAAEPAVMVPPAAMKETPAPAATSEKAVLAGGCFWGVQGVFQHVKGVSKPCPAMPAARSDTADYEQVSSGPTGHAESSRSPSIRAQISYGTHAAGLFLGGPRSDRAQSPGSRHGTQYRSAIFADQ